MKQKPFLCCACLGALLTLASCVCENLGDNGTKAVRLELELAMPLATSAYGDGYEDGDEYENAINMAGGDYRIYFYNTSNQFVAELESPIVSSTSGDGNTTYTVSGTVPEEMTEMTELKVVMLANWGTYTTPTSGSTIESLCDNQYATFTALTTDEFDLGTSGRQLPFYGVHEYKNVEFSYGETTVLSEMTLLRAVAKVEVILTNELSDGVSFEDVSIVGYNSEGYCAPTGVYSQEDYGQPSTWKTDYVEDVHLVNEGKNDVDATSRTMAFWKANEATSDGTQQETWTAYLPEYDNSDEDYSYIQVSVQGTTYNIYFADYGEEGTTDAYNEGDTGDRWNVRRNNLYRYYVTVTPDPAIKVHVDKWEACFDSEYYFPGANDDQ